MSIATLREALPEWAKDMSLNLSSLTRSTVLNEQQLWGTFLAAAAATRNESVLVQVAEEAKQHLSEEAVSAALGAATVMGMNNIAYRTREFLGSEEYDAVRMGLRMNLIASLPESVASDFELWSIAVSAVNGCQKCVGAHAAKARTAGFSAEQVWEAARVAATLFGTAQAISVVETLA